MRIRSNRIYPYPVFSVFSRDYSNNSFKVESDIEYDAETATVLLDVELADSQINDLICSQKAGLYCHLDCPTTKYREIFEVKLNEQNHYEHELELQQINGWIEITCLIVARENIIGFEDDNFANLYAGAKANFPQYATIGYTETNEVEIEKRTDTNGEVPSIFQITRSESDERNITYDASSDYIYIYLPHEQHDIYIDYRGVNKRLKTMMINFPVLTEILDDINTGNQDYSDRPWFDVIDHALSKKGYNALGKDFTTRSAVEVAQALLGDLAKDAFKEFDDLCSKQ